MKDISNSFNNDRAQLDRCMQFLAEQGILTKETVVSASFLRMDVRLQNTKSLYAFDPLKNNNLNTPMELRLDINDSFFGTHLGVRLFQAVSTDPYNKPLQTYPSPDYFGVAAPGYEPEDLETIYQGRLSLKVQSKTVIENIDMLSFRHVPETQNNSATGLKAQFTEFQGLKMMSPNFLLNGKANNKFEVELPFDNGVEVEPVVANTHNYMSLYVKGFLVKNVSFGNGRS